jgi:hypothetical protein
MTDTIHSGLASQLMISQEVTYGTWVAPARSLEMVSESMKTTIERIESKGLRAGRRIVGKWLPGKTSSAGDIDLEVNGIGFGMVLAQIFGTDAITGPTDTVAYTHTLSPTDLPPGFSMQIGKPSIDGTVNPFNYTGCRVNTAELSLKTGELLGLKLGVVGQAETYAATHALLAYTDPSIYLMSFVGASVTCGGVAVALTDFNFKVDNKLDATRFRIASQATIKQPLENSWREYTGTLAADFESMTQYNHFVNGDELSVVASFVGALIPGAATTHYSLTLTANCRYDGETPVVSGPGLVPLTLPVKVSASGSTDAAAISLVYVTSDAAA